MGALLVVLIGLSLVAWLRPPPEYAPAGPVDGANLFFTRGCVGCHAVRGSVASSFGPDLTDLPNRAGGRVEGMTAEDYVREAIREPGTFVVSGYSAKMMPKLPLTDDEVDALVNFLMSAA